VNCIGGMEMNLGRHGLDVEPRAEASKTQDDLTDVSLDCVVTGFSDAFIPLTHT
jgi:hypothetical protein